MLKESVQYAEDEATLSTLLEMIPTDEDPAFTQLAKETQEKLERIKIGGEVIVQQEQTEKTANNAQEEILEAPTEVAIVEQEIVQQTASTLPDGWTQHIDTESGSPYYFNEATGEQVWEMPTKEAVIGEESAVVEFAVEPAVETESTVDPDPVVVEPQADPGATQEEISPEVVPTEKKQEEPKEIIVASQENQEVVKLPDGWTEQMDKESGSPYYYNETTGEQVWEMPTESAVPVVEAIEAVAEKPVEDIIKDPVEPVEKITEPGETIPEGWATYMDEESGSPYYYNTISGTQVWEIPTITATEAAATENEEPEANGLATYSIDA